MSTSRRAFTQIVFGAGAACANGKERAVDIGNRPQLFLHDDYLIGTKQGLRLAMTTPVKFPGNPVLKPDKPWELGEIGYGCLIHEREDGVYKLWYESRENNGILGDPSRPERGRCMYAISRNGIEWDKPAVGQVPILGSRDHNVVFTGPPGQRSKVYWVMKDHADPDPAKRYKMMFHLWDFRGRGVSIAHSPDGIRWTASRYTNLTGGFDTQNLFLWDDRLGLYTGYLRTRRDGRRCIGRSTSPDGFHWSNPSTIHCPDDRDPARFDLYTPGVFKYSRAENVYIMVTAAFDWASDRLFGQLCLSRNGIDWYRFREPFVPLGQKGDWDSGAIYTVPSEALVQGQTAIYYQANDFGHGAGGRTGIGIALLQEGAFAGWKADQEGVLTTPLLDCELVSDAFLLNADATGGSIEAELLDRSGSVIPGFTRTASIPVRTKGGSLLLRWKGDPKRAGEARLRLYLKQATVFGFQARRLRKEDINE